MESKLYHGDCMEIMPTLPDGCADLILCDLPYGCTVAKWDTNLPLDKLWLQYKRLIKPGGIIALFGDYPFSTKLINSNPKWHKYDWYPQMIGGVDLELGD